MMTSMNTSAKCSRYADELSADAVLVGEEPVGVGGARAAWQASNKRENASGAHMLKLLP